MAVEIINSSLLKYKEIDEPNRAVLLTIFDRAAFDLHVPALYAFLPPTPSNRALKAGLSRVLSHFPHLAGRIVDDDRCRPSILLSNTGARVVEARVSATLSESLPLESSGVDLSQLHPCIEKGVEELLQVQLNRYACGGLVIGTTSHHRVADGQSMSVFFAAWAKMVRSGEPPFPPPFLDRGAAVVPRSPPRSQFNHGQIEFKNSEACVGGGEICAVENLKARFSADFISDLKSLVPFRCSTFEALLAHLWRKITSARGLSVDQKTSIRVAVNGRSRLRLPRAIPADLLFGNMVLWAHPEATVGELLMPSAGGSGQAKAVRIIHEAIQAVDEEYFRSFIDFGESERDRPMTATAPAEGNLLCPNLEVDSWQRFNFHDLDFGGGPPCAFLPPNLPVEGLLIFVPSAKEKGDIHVYLALKADHVDKFNKICYTLD